MEKEFFNSIDKKTYMTRAADSNWKNFIQSHVNIKNKIAADIGPGGGIYSIALSELGASHVIGIDISENMIKGAMENCREYPNIQFQIGTANQTNLPDHTVDIILERALIHHLKENQLSECFMEARRILSHDGTFIIQDRTIEDCFIDGSLHHIRGYFFDIFPELKKKEFARRHSVETVSHHLRSIGFTTISVVSFWEKRKTYKSINELKQEIISRKGRSILFELTDSQLYYLADEIEKSVVGNFPLVEKERWTIWFANVK